MSDQLKQATKSAKDTSAAVLDAASHAATDATEKAKQAASVVSDAAHGFADKAMRGLSGLLHKAADKIGGAKPNE